MIREFKNERNAQKFNPTLRIKNKEKQKFGSIVALFSNKAFKVFLAFALVLGLMPHLALSTTTAGESTAVANDEVYQEEELEANSYENELEAAPAEEEQAAEEEEQPSEEEGQPAEEEQSTEGDQPSEEEQTSEEAQQSQEQITQQLSLQQIDPENDSTFLASLGGTTEQNASSVITVRKEAGATKFFST